MHGPAAMLVGVSLLLLSVGGCEASFQASTRTAGYVVFEPPPPRRAAAQRRRPPSPRAVWVEGHWVWDGRQYRWRRGHWIRPRPGYIFVQPRWARRGRGWVFVEGHWERAGRSDDRRRPRPRRRDRR